MTVRTIAATCLHAWECSDVPGVFDCVACDAEAMYDRNTKIYWIEETH